MCLIMFSPEGKLPDRDLFVAANDDNPHGIGVMSARGVERFNGKRRSRRAWNYAQALAADSVPFAVHFRWATHGEPHPRLTHPFETAEGLYVMHNGVISATTARADAWNKTHGKDEQHSDTSVFVRDFLENVPRVSDALFRSWRSLVEYTIGYGSKLCIFDPRENEFMLLNEDCGHWDSDGLWYSNFHSHRWAYYSRPGMGEARGAHTFWPDACSVATSAAEAAHAYAVDHDAEIGGTLSAAMAARDFDRWDAIDHDTGTTCLDCGSELFTNEYHDRQCKNCKAVEQALRDPDNAELTLAEGNALRARSNVSHFPIVRADESLADAMRAAHLAKTAKGG